MRQVTEMEMCIKSRYRVCKVGQESGRLKTKGIKSEVIKNAMRREE